MNSSGVRDSAVRPSRCGFGAPVQSRTCSCPASGSSVVLAVARAKRIMPTPPLRSRTNTCTGGRLTLTRRGLSPRKRRRAKLGAITLGVSPTNGGALTLEGVTLSGGIKTGDGGGLYASTSSNITLRDNLFMNIRATLKGGGAYITNVDRVLDEIWSDWTLADSPGAVLIPTVCRHALPRFVHLATGHLSHTEVPPERWRQGPESTCWRRRRREQRRRQYSPERTLPKREGWRKRSRSTPTATTRGSPFDRLQRTLHRLSQSTPYATLIDGSLCRLGLRGAHSGEGDRPGPLKKLV